jgi:hypothetical protein
MGTTPNELIGKATYRGQKATDYEVRIDREGITVFVLRRIKYPEGSPVVGTINVRFVFN